MNEDTPFVDRERRQTRRMLQFARFQSSGSGGLVKDVKEILVLGLFGIGRPSDDLGLALIVVLSGGNELNGLIDAFKCTEHPCYAYI